MGGECTCADGRRRDLWVIRELDLETRECPASLVTDSSWEFLSLFQHYKSGFLPFDGGILAQPRVFSEAMHIIATEVSSEH